MASSDDFDAKTLFIKDCLQVCERANFDQTFQLFV